MIFRLVFLKIHRSINFVGTLEGKEQAFNSDLLINNRKNKQRDGLVWRTHRLRKRSGGVYKVQLCEIDWVFIKDNRHMRHGDYHARREHTSPRVHYINRNPRNLNHHYNSHIFFSLEGQTRKQYSIRVDQIRGIRCSPCEIFASLLAEVPQRSFLKVTITCWVARWLTERIYDWLRLKDWVCQNNHIYI